MSELVKFVFFLRENGIFDNLMESYCVFIVKRLIEIFNLILNEVVMLIGMVDGFLVNVLFFFLFKSFFNVIVVYFKLNLSEVIKIL